MTVQDDERERELCGLFNLNWDQDHQRGGMDASFTVEVKGTKYFIPVEVKSTTGSTVATARDVGLDHISKWRRVMWVIGYYTKDRGRPAVEKLLCLTPGDMRPWIDQISKKIEPDMLLAQRASRLLNLEDLFSICGEKPYYEVEDAKRLHKQQWSKAEYDLARDITQGKSKKISQAKMLEILKLRAEYIAKRGSTLNNPHVGKAFLDSFHNSEKHMGRSDEPSGKIRAIVRDYIEKNPDHPFPTHP